MENDIFSFDDFMKKDVSEIEPKSIKESNIEIDEDNILNIDESESLESDEFLTTPFAPKTAIATTSLPATDINYYNVFLDKNEEFSCDISVEGAETGETEVRLIIESDSWVLMFNGSISEGKCTIPIRKLNILNEGDIGNIRLEVIADGNLFVPWRDKFKAKLSKKVTVSVNEQLKSKVEKPQTNVKVKSIK